MERIVNYFEHIPSSHRSLILVGGITVFWLIESAVPLIRFSYRKWHHAGINIFFTLTTIVVNFALAFILLRTSDWAVQNNVGLLQWLERSDARLPLWAEAIIGLLFLDLVGAWLPHFVEHKVKFLWRFHLIHHTDAYVDTTTANRHHPGESVIRFAFTTVGVLLTGAPMWLVFMYQAISVALSQFNHANIELPRWADRVLSWFIVTPNMHHVHHHYVLPVTNTNYGNIFPYWDRLFGTYHEMPGKDLIYGIDTHPEPREHSHIGSLLKIPFQKYREPVGEKRPEPETA
ncbi:sterol desaturase family protein [Spirosoma montaniterrae]|uniref:Sterol desaturase n=1 Tax=Spirosoma montaniterrae TaxID=1178516 RepID=A0A1P9WWC2_9BACT|nr:sterol desaturase family protein [Spirosoma montaniterrae]AQG79692.1 sterol desaturase [Spirosoma montaniterrae]